MADEKARVVGKVAIKVVPDTSKFRESLRKELRKIQATLGDLKVQVQLDKKAAKQLQRDLRDWVKEVSPLKVDVRPVLTKSHSVVRERLRSLSRPRTVEYSPVINTAAYGKTAAALSGIRLAGDWMTNLRDMLKDLDKNLPTITAWSLGLGGLVGWLGSATSNMAALSAELARIAPLALALPGAFGGMAIGLGATVAVLKDFNQVIPELADQLHDLQDAMSAKFWAQAEAPIRSLIDSLLPQFSAGLQQVSTQLGGFFGQLATSLTGSLDGSLEGMFDDLAASIAVAAGGTDAWAEAIRILGETGAGYLPRLAAWVTDISTRFSGWLAAAEADGSLNAWINTAITNLGLLGSILASVGSIFAGIAQAAEAAGGSSFATLNNSLQNIADTVHSPAFQEGLTGFFEGAHQAMANIAATSGAQFKDLLVTLGETSQSVLPIIGASIGTLVGALSEGLATDTVQAGLLDFFSGLHVGINELVTAVGPLASAFGPLLSLLGTFAATAGPLLSGILSTLATALARVLPSLEPLVEFLGGAFLAVWNAVSPLILAAADAFGVLIDAIPFDELTVMVSDFASTLGEGLAPLGESFGSIAATLAPIAGQILPPLIDAALGLAEAFLPFLEIAGKLVAEVVAPLLAKYLPKLTDVFTGLINDAVIPLVSAFADLVNLLLPILLPALKFIGDVLLADLTFAFSAVADVIGGVMKIITGVIDIIVGVFTGDWEKAWEGVKTIFAGVWDVIVGLLKIAWILLTDVVLAGVGKLLGLLGKLVGKLFSWLGGLLGRFFSWVVEKLGLDKLWNWLSEWASKLGEWFAGLGKKFWDWISGLASRAWEGMKRLWDRLVALQGEWALKMMVKFKQFKAKAIGWVKGLGGRLSNWFSRLWTRIVDTAKDWARNMGKKLRDAKDAMMKRAREIKSLLPKRIREAIDNAIDYVKKLPKKAKKALGDIKDTLLEAGKNLIRGFLAGIEHMWEEVKSSLSELTDKLTEWKGPPRRDAVLLFDAGQLIVDGLISGLESRYGLVKKSLSGFSNDLASTVIAAPTIADVADQSADLVGRETAGTDTAGGGETKVLNYYAAPGPALESQEALFRAADRAARMRW